ncbi:DUF4258 domain-containing protein [Myxococcus qinghaiensis]|uniref:DUF4258 domain-containing protein n=1 Tax=Myxococcus qinghaiensis TaxID=2906758 RepID=UPI0020A7D48A|nr:DUF4258 domain-containing protein [Myxococcus qinghaiensis]MCP3169963.1 DUF4258 domain-containing protein [Myxococcus qinghaiensis]
MPANDNRFETYRTEGRFTLTNHAKERMATRGLRADAIDATLAYGRVVYVRGADIYAIGRREIARYTEEGIDLSAYNGVQVVVTADGAILTVYRNRSFNGLRGRRTDRRRPLALVA